MKASGVGSCVAIDLDATAVRAVEMEWTKTGNDTSGARVVRQGSAPLPSGIWNDLVAGQQAFADAIRSALSAAGISARSVVAGVPRRLVTVRFARLPHAPPDQMRSMVAFEAQQYILFSLDEVILDYHVLPELTGFTTGGDDMDTVLLAAARRTLIADLTAIFDRAGLELQRFSVSALALAEHVRDALEATAIMDIEPGEIEVAVVSDGRLMFTRSAALSNENILPEIALRRVIEEVARSFTAYQNEFRNQPLAHIYLVGSSLPGLDSHESEQTLSDVLGMPVSYMHTRLLDAPRLEYATALGIALQTRTESIAPINLYPNERAMQKAQHVKRQRGVLAAVLVGILAIGAISFAAKQWDARTKDFQETVRANDALKAVTTQVDAREKVHKRLLDLETDLNSGLNRTHPSVDMLVALDQALPHTSAIWLTQLAFERNGLITLRGESKSEAAATDFVISLQKAGPFSDVRLGYLGDAEDTSGRGSGDTTTPAPTTAPPAGQPAPAKKAARATLTSFIITCRVNPGVPTLLPAKLVTPAEKTQTKGNGKAKHVGNGQDDGGFSDEMGDELGDQ